MNSTIGYYSIIQFCPDPSRREVANVGVVLLCPEIGFLQTRMAKGTHRIKEVFPGLRHDRERLRSTLQNIADRLRVDRDHFQTVEALRHFAATRANEMRLTLPQFTRVDDPPEVELDRLFDRLVGDSVRTGVVRLRKLLDRSFHAADVAPYICRNLTVTLPGFQRAVRVPYAFQNGRLNLIQVAQFRGLNGGAIIRKAGRYAFEGDLLYRHPDSTLGDLKLIVVGQFATEQQDIVAAVEEVLEDNRTDLYTTQELDRLLDFIRTTGKPVSGEAVK